MSHTTFTNGVTLTEAAWFQDVDTVAYTLFGNGTSYTGVLTLAGTTQSTSTTTGQAIISGGMGLAKNLWVGGTGNFAGALTLQSTLTLGGTVSGGGNQINNVVIGTSTPLAVTGTTMTGNSFVPNSSTVPTNGMYLSAANTLAWSTNSVFGMSFASGVLLQSSTAPTHTLKRSNSTTAFGLINFTGSDDVIDWQISTNNAVSGAFEVNQGDGTTAANKRLYIASDGYLKITDNGTTQAGVYHEVNNAGTNFSWTVFARHATGANGINVSYITATPNDGSHDFLYCNDASVLRAAIRSNGGLSNYSANNVNLSDLSVKPDFITYFDAGETEKVWKFGKRMRNAWGKWHYIDQTHTDWNNGVGAQLVQEAAGTDFPELTELSNWGTKENPQIRLAVYDNDLMHLMGAITTESQYRIDDHESRMKAIEAKLGIQ